MSQQKHTPEPFGHFKADAFGWTDCAETDEGAQPLYDQAAIDQLGERLMVSDYALKDAERQRDALLAALKLVAEIPVADHYRVGSIARTAIAAVEQPEEGSGPATQAARRSVVDWAVQDEREVGK